MRLATRTGLAAFASALLAATLIGVVVQVRFGRVLEEGTDAQLDERRATAPILVAVADRLTQSELNGIVEGARVARDIGAGQRVIDVGQLPDDPLPVPAADGYRTVSADGERWRLLDVEVRDVPAVGDVAYVQLVAPLGDVDARSRQLRRQLTVVGVVVSLLAGFVGYALGRRAARPLSRLRDNAEAIEHADPSAWHVDNASGAPDVDDVAEALNSSLARLADETAQRDAALASARAFASSAAHEMRTPLQSALTNLDIANSPAASEAAVREAVTLAREQLLRAAVGLTAIRALANAELADQSWFVPCDLVEIVDSAVADERRTVDGAANIELVIDDGASDPIVLWPDGMQLAVANLIRNALRHGGGLSGGRVVVTVGDGVVSVDDDGPGIAIDDRERVLQRFERGGAAAANVPGSGLGLAIADQVARAHGGRVTVGESAGGGARVVLTCGGADRGL
ncbi:MAG TPA: HAMP domain-containing sensor histidine kinase [Ilumatobacter sp.]|nr:HAMP domain-containing sensor histidine kinase [Ilumatobacter sp.]